MFESQDSLPICPLLWTQLKSKFPKSEIDELKLMIGPQLIDMNEELKVEYENLASIYDELLNDPEVQSNEQMRNLQKSKNMFLEKEIGFLIQNLKKRAEQMGVEDSLLIPIKTDREKKIYSEICKMNSSNISSRPTTSSSSRTTSNFNAKPTNTMTESMKMANSFCFDDSIAKRIPKNINIIENEEIILGILGDIRESLKEEQHQLLQNIELIKQNILMHGIQKNKKKNDTEITTTELQAFNKKLEQEYLKKPSTPMKTQNEPKNKTILAKIQGFQIGENPTPKILKVKPLPNPPKKNQLTFQRKFSSKMAGLEKGSIQKRSTSHQNKEQSKENHEEQYIEHNIDEISIDQSDDFEVLLKSKNSNMSGVNVFKVKKSLSNQNSKKEPEKASKAQRLRNVIKNTRTQFKS